MSTIDEMIASVQDAQIRAENERKDGIEKYKAEAETLLQSASALAVVWDELSEYVQKVDISGDEKGVTIVYEVNAPDTLRIAPFYVACTANARGTSTHFRYSKRGDNHNISLAELLARQRLAYPQHFESVLKEHTKSLVEALHYNGGTKSPQEAHSALRRLCNIWPERTAGWEKLHKEWIEAFERVRVYEAAYRLESEKRQRERDAFASGWEVYLRKAAEVLACNRTKVAVLQVTLDVPYTAQEYEYGISCHEESGRVDTRKVWVSPDHPNSQYVKVFHRGRVEERFFYDPVSHGKPIALRPTDGHETAGKVFVQLARDWLYYAPGMDAQGEIDALDLEDFPAKPIPPGWMSSFDVRNICGDYDGFPE